MKKNLTKLIIVVVLFSSLVLPNKKAEAQFFDFAAFADRILNVASMYVKDVLIKKLVSQTAAWANGGFDKAGSSFIKNWDEFLKDTAMGAIEYSYLSAKQGLENSLNNSFNNNSPSVTMFAYGSCEQTEEDRLSLEWNDQYGGDTSETEPDFTQEAKSICLEECIALENSNILNNWGPDPDLNLILSMAEEACGEISQGNTYTYTSNNNQNTNVDFSGNFNKETVKRDIVKILANTGVAELVKDPLDTFLNSYSLDKVAGENWENNILDGGWAAYISQTNLANNKLGMVLTTTQIAKETIEDAKKTKTEDIKTAAGKFLGKVVCKEESDLSDTNDNPICAKNSTSTPGMLVGKQIADSMGVSLEGLEGSQTWGEVLVASITTLADAFMQQGLNKLVGAVSDSSDEPTYAFTEETSQDEDVYPDQEEIISNNDFENIFIGGPEHISNNPSKWVTAPTIIVNLHKELETNLKYIDDELSFLRKIELRLLRMPKLLVDIDVLLPGPGRGWEDRLKKYFDRNISKMERKVSVQDNDGALASENYLEIMKKELDFSIVYTKSGILNSFINIPGAVDIKILMDGIIDVNKGGYQLQRKDKEKREITKNNLFNIIRDIKGSKSFIRDKEIEFMGGTIILNNIIMFESDWDKLTEIEKDELISILLSSEEFSAISKVFVTEEQKRDSVIRVTWEIWRELLETDDIDIAFDGFSGKNFKKKVRYTFNEMKNSLSNMNLVEKSRIKYEQIDDNHNNLENIKHDLLQLRNKVREIAGGEDEDLAEVSPRPILELELYEYLKEQGRLCISSGNFQNVGCEFKSDIIISDISLENSIFVWSLRDLNIFPTISGDMVEMYNSVLNPERHLQFGSAPSMLNIYRFEIYISNLKDHHNYNHFLCGLPAFFNNHLYGEDDYGPSPKFLWWPNNGKRSINCQGDADGQSRNVSWGATSILDYMLLIFG